MSNERLQEITERYMPLEYDFNLNTSDIDFLIKRVEVLESREEVRKMGDEANSKYYGKIEQQNKRYREALEFYADENNYKWEVTNNPQQKVECMVLDDSGHAAIKSLEESE